jgi:hypothetical protein
MDEKEPSEPKPEPKPSREDEAREIVREYISDQRAIAEKLLRKLN